MTGSRVSCCEFSFPTVPGLSERLGIVRLLGFELVDVSMFLEEGSDLCARSSSIGQSFRRLLRDHGLTGADLFLAVGRSVEEVALNSLSASVRGRHRNEFLACLDAACEAEIAGITLLPGVTWPESPGKSWGCCVEELNWRTAQAEAHELDLRVEPHIGSIISTPELAARLCAEVSGLKLTLDPAHFVMQAIGDERINSLAGLTGNVHIRAARPGELQVKWRLNEGGFERLISKLDQVGYSGSFAIEYVYLAKWRCDEVDVVSETLLTRDALRGMGIR